jgi:hypothetical protein
MIIRKKLLLLIFCLFLGSISFADIHVTSWKQDVLFNSSGQEVVISAELVAGGLEKGYYHSSWSFIFDEKSNIKMLGNKILNNSPNNKIEFSNNRLKFEFDELRNGEKISIAFKYQEINKELETLKYIRQEAVIIPNWVKGVTSLRVRTPAELDIYSLNDKFKKSEDNTYIWSGFLNGKDGFSDIFQMTRKKARWEVTTRVEFTNDKPIKNVKANIPLNFIGGNNNVIEYNVYNTQVNYIDNDRISKNRDSISVDFKNLNSKEGFIELRAILENNYNNFSWMNDLDLNNILKIEEQYESQLRTLGQKIIVEDNSNSPNYIKIGKWVHKNIKYDIFYFGKNLTTLEILEHRKGVCEHYAILYQDLLRAMGIPAQTVSGISYSYEKKSFENHAWVIVNHNSSWLPIDPTWGIFSGKLPISHIFMFNYIKTPYGFTSTDKLQNFNIKIINDANFIE